MADLHRLPLAVQRAVAPVLEMTGPRVAAFDADGTLWRGDVGEDLLRYLGANKLLARGEGVFSEYERLHHDAPVEAYGFAVEVMAGLQEAALTEICADFFARRFAGRLFAFVRPLFDVLRAADVTIWICSASPRWIVQAAGAHLGLPPSRIIGVDADLDHGVLTSRLRRPITAGPGKVHWLEAHGARPTFAAGNGDLDLDMLEAATHRLVISPPDGPENALVRHARTHGWPILKT